MNDWFQNGERVRTAPIDDRAFQYGDGLFETIAIRGGAPRLWPLHAARLAAGCRRLEIVPPADEQLDELEQRESLVSWNHLHGKRGETTTQLTPSGKARFGDEVIDVISDGEVIAKGAAVYVSEVDGNRVLVHPVDAEAS